MPRKRRVLIAIVGLIALLVIWIRWDSLRYHGDGRLSGPHFFRPRYVVTFSDIPLYEVGEHHFHFRGIPNEEMTLVLYVKNIQVDTEEERAPLENLQVTIEATLTDDKGNVACKALGRPASGERDGVWILESGGVAGYWHEQCNPVQVYPNSTYDLMIRVSNVGPQVERVLVTPTLEGGGEELP